MDGAFTEANGPPGGTPESKAWSLQGRGHSGRSRSLSSLRPLAADHQAIKP